MSEKKIIEKATAKIKNPITGVLEEWEAIRYDNGDLVFGKSFGLFTIPNLEGSNSLRPPYNPLIEHLKEEDRKYHEELKKYYPDYELRNESNPFSFAWERKRGRTSKAIYLARDFSELWYADKVAKFGSNPFQEYDDKFKEKHTPGMLMVKRRERFSNV